jgi:eukaryotic-like serine/threonine-protein kinase
MPLSPPVRGPSRDPLRDWFPTAKINEGRWSLLLRVKPASAPSTESSSFVLRMVRAPARSDSFAHRRLAQEVAVTHAVRHSALPPVVDFELHGAHPFTVTPFVSGYSAAKWRLSKNRCPLGLACWIARQIAEALAKLHVAGLRHGELDPANVHVRQEGLISLLGLSGAAKIGSLEAGCQFGINPAYAAPEQFKPGNAATPFSDVYSLGAVLFELVTKRIPFQSEDAAELEAMHTIAPVPDVRTLAPDAPYALSVLIRRMLSKEPLRRPDIQQVAYQLSDFEITSFRDWAVVA